LFCFNPIPPFSYEGKNERKNIKLEITNGSKIIAGTGIRGLNAATLHQHF
jgi:hypothetical protein